MSQVIKTERWRDWLALLGFGALTLVFAYPLPLQLRTHLAGAGDDMWIFYWNNWWVKEALLQRLNVYWTPYLYAPAGANLVFHSFSWLNTLQALALEPLTGPFAAYNLVVLLGLVLNGWGAYLLVTYLTGRRAAGFVAGLVFAFVPYRMTQLDHPLFSSVAWIPLLFLFLLRAVKEGRLVHALAAGLFLALAGSVAWHLYIYAWMAVAGYFVYLLVFERRLLTARTIGRLAVACVVAVVLVLPLLVPLLQVQLSGAADEEIYVPQEEKTQTDALAYVLPNRLQPVYGRFFDPLYEDFKRNRNYIAFLGLTAMALAVVGIVRARRKALFWALLCGFFGLMALGPVLRFNGQLYPQVPMPYRLIGWIPFVKLLKQPDRFNIVFSFPLAVLVGYGVKDLCTRAESWWARRRNLRQAWKATLLVSTICGLLIGWEYLCIPAWTIKGSYPAGVERLRTVEGEFAILDIPMGRELDKLYLYYQTVHGRPIVGGHISRPLPGTLSFIEGNPLLTSLHARQLLDMDPDALEQARAALAQEGVRYIVLHKWRSPAELEQNWRASFAGWQVYEDEGVVVYATGPEAAW